MLIRLDHESGNTIDPRTTNICQWRRCRQSFVLRLRQGCVFLHRINLSTHFRLAADYNAASVIARIWSTRGRICGDCFTCSKQQCRGE